MEGILESKEGRSRENKNFVLAVGLYNRDLCFSVTSFFTINLPTSCTKDVRAWALIPSYNTPILWRRRRYCDVYTQRENTLSISLGRNQSMKVRDVQLHSKKRVQLQSYHRKWSNITWILHHQEENMNYSEIYKNEQYKMELTSYNKKSREPSRKG